MGGMSEYAFSTKMRDTLITLTEAVVQRLRPADRYGVVQTIDTVNHKCTVLLTGDPVPITVNMGAMQPSVIGVNVRVSGTAGDKYIADVFDGSALTPVGSLLQFGGSTAPPGWIICDGTLLTVASYPGLYAVLGTKFNTGGETAGVNFRIPDLRDRSAVGASATKAAGSAAGSASAALAAANLPAHAHGAGTLAAASNSNAHNHDMGSHTHDVDWNYIVGPNPSGTGYNFAVSIGGTFNTDGTDSNGTTTGPSTNTTGLNSSGANHSHTMSGSTDNGPGSATPLAVQNPYVAVHYIIKT